MFDIKKGNVRLVAMVLQDSLPSYKIQDDIHSV